MNTEKSQSMNTISKSQRLGEIGQMAGVGWKRLRNSNGKGEIIPEDDNKNGPPR